MKKNDSSILTNIYGVGLRSPHYSHLESNSPKEAGWFEVITENYFRTNGRPRVVLEKLRKDYPVACHGVSLSVASYEDFDKRYLNDLKKFFQEIDPFIVSDHLCYTGLGDNNLHNLLPFAYNEENLKHLINRIDEVQNFLGRKMAYENLSAYFDYNESTYTEWEFIAELAKRSGCDLLLDLNNIFVNSYNHEFDCDDYLKAIPLDQVAEIHMAGYSERENFYFDTHSGPLYSGLIELYKKVRMKKSNIPVLYEWDENIPEFSVLEEQIKILKQI